MLSNLQEQDFFDEIIEDHSKLIQSKNNGNLSLEEAGIFLDRLRISASSIIDIGRRKHLRSCATYWGQFIYNNTQPNRFPLTSLNRSEEYYSGSSRKGSIASDLFGRETDLRVLENWLLEEQACLVSIFGIGGIGKTSLALHLREHVKDEFDENYFLSLITAPYADNLLDGLIDSLQNSSLDSSQMDFNAKLSALVDYFRNNRCLLILDNFETVLPTDPSKKNRSFQAKYNGYIVLIDKILNLKHQSCVLLTSREKPAIVPVNYKYSWDLKGLDLEATGKLFASQNLPIESNSQKALQKISDFYNGNPFYLKIVSAEIKNEHNSDINQFHDFLIREIENGRLEIDGLLENVLESQFDRLTEVELNLIYWLAINRESVNEKILRKDLLLKKTDDLKEVIDSLAKRNLVEIRHKKIGLQNVIWEYTKDKFVKRIVGDFEKSYISLINSHALIKANMDEDIRRSQKTSFVDPFINRLDVNNLEKQFKDLLYRCKNLPKKQQKYLAGNILNLLCIFKSNEEYVDLRDFDFSDLTIRQVYLQGTNVHHLDLTDSEMHDCIFTQTFGSIWSVSFSPDSKYFATADNNNKVCMWSIKKKDGPLWCNEEHKNWVRSVAFSPAKKYLLLSGSNDQTLNLWNIERIKDENGYSIQRNQGGNNRGHTGRILSVAFSQDGQHIASASGDKTVKIWTSEGEYLRDLDDFTEKALSIAFSYDNKFIASGHENCIVKLWEVDTGRCIRTFPESDAINSGHSKEVRSVAFSPDGNHIISGSEDKTLKLWSVETGEYRATFPAFDQDNIENNDGSDSNDNMQRYDGGHSEGIRSVAFSPDNKIVASGSDDKTVKLWSIETGQCLDTLGGHKNWVRSVAFSPDGKFIVSGSDGQTVKLWSVETHQCLQTFQAYRNAIWSVSFSPNGKHLVSGNEDKTVRLWDLETEKYKTLEGHGNWVRSVVFDSSGNRIVSGSEDKTVKIWDSETGKEIRTFKKQEHRLWAVAFSPNGKFIASSGEGPAVNLYSASTDECIDLHGHTDGIWAIAFSSDGALIASGSDDKTVKLWDVEEAWISNDSAKSSANFISLPLEEEKDKGHEHWVRSLAFSPDGQILASGSEDKTIKLWDVKTGKYLNTFKGHDDKIRSVAFSPNGKLIASGSDDQLVMLWNADTGECYRCLEGHKDSVRSVTFNPQDGKMIATASEDQTIKIWDVDTGECLRELRLPRPYEYMKLTRVQGLSKTQKEALIDLGATE